VKSPVVGTIIAEVVTLVLFAALKLRAEFWADRKEDAIKVDTTVRVNFNLIEPIFFR
jgi:hypothetical protein